MPARPFTALIIVLIALITGGCTNAASAPLTARSTSTSAGTSTSGGTSRTGTVSPHVIIHMVTFIDASRSLKYPHHHVVPRSLVTVIRYPAAVAGPLPLIVFGHGFAVTPADYYRLLTAWAQAGYVVAAPVFPLENAHAPGGPDEADLVNQPADMSFVITGMLALAAQRRSFLAGRISPGRIGISGQSDGGETALAMAYDRSYRDPRVRAAAILSGAQLPSSQAGSFPRPSPPLLATQGTADMTNRPHFTYDFFRAATRPKYLLRLLGAGHLAPYTTQQPQLSIIERVTTGFFDRYLKGERAGETAMAKTGNVRGLAALTAVP
ncbi:MAG: hypothetical protein M3022_05975 [Actinomycetota bacterium]|nr:hypothetical protein [Actinomycetota bacterium]